MSIIDIVPMEYWCGYVGSNDTLYALYGTMIPLPLPSARLVRKSAGCFNLFRTLATDGSLWQSQQYNAGSMSWTQIPTDSSGASINGLWINGYADNYILLNSDSSLSAGGTDDAFIFHSSGSVFMRPYKFSGAIKFRKALYCARGIYAVTSDSTSLYYWGAGAGTTPTSIYTFSGQGTGKIIDFACSNGNAFTSATFAVIQQTSGSAYGKPYALGQGYGFWGSATPQNFTTFTNLYSQWGLSSLVKEICVNFETTTIIDSIGNMFATGWNVMGEVGIGSEYVNRYTYVNWPNYGWDGNGGENPVTGLPQIGAGTHWEHVYSNLFFTYYHAATDINDSCWFWGRNKTAVQPRGYVLNTTDNAAQPNALDILSPSMASPFGETSIKILNWTGPTIGISGTTTLNISTTSLTATGHPALAINASNNSDTVNYHPSAWAWSKVSGPSGDVIVSPSSQTTSISGLVSGTYVYQVLTTDNNQGMNLASVTLNVSINPPIVIPKGFKVKVN